MRPGCSLSTMFTRYLLTTKHGAQHWQTMWSRMALDRQEFRTNSHTNKQVMTNSHLCWKELYGGEGVWNGWVEGGTGRGWLWPKKGDQEKLFWGNVMCWSQGWGLIGKECKQCKSVNSLCGRRRHDQMGEVESSLWGTLGAVGSGQPPGPRQRA